MGDDDMMLETPTRTPATRVMAREGGAPPFALPAAARSPSRRLKDQFFATYTGGAAPLSASPQGGMGAASFMSAALQTPTKAPRAGPAQSDHLARLGDSMDIDPPAAAHAQAGADAAHISVEDLQGPAVPLAIGASGRFYSEHLRRCELQIELMNLGPQGHTPRGVYVMPSLGSINVWHGVMFVKRGYWHDAVVRFSIDIPREYPRTHPIFTLATPVSHPLVRLEDGRFALEQQFPQWTPYSDCIFHALHYLKNAFKNRVLKQLQSRDCYNIDAYMKFKNDLPRFREQARIDSMKSRQPQALYSAQPADCPIVFSRLSDEQFESAMQQMRLSAGAAGSRPAVR